MTPATINEDLRRRDFTCNAMALSLNEGSRGLLLDPFNGAADIEARLLRVLHSYAFLEDPSRLIRATRFAARFGWELEERTRARYDSAREGEYIQFLGSRAIGYEIEQIAHEENPIAVMQALEEQGWLKVLCPKWTVAKANVPELAQLLKTRATMAEFNIRVDAAPAVMHFLTRETGRGRDRGDSAADPASRVCGCLEAAGERRQGAFQEAAVQRGRAELRRMEDSLLGKAGGAALPGCHRPQQNGGRKDKELPWEMAATSGKDSGYADGGVAHHASASGVFADLPGGVPAAAGRKAALRGRDHEVSRSLRAASASASAHAGAPWTSSRQEGSPRCAAKAAVAEAGGCGCRREAAARCRHSAPPESSEGGG